MLSLDSYILLSVINTKLRDYYENLQSLCYDLNLDIDKLKAKLELIGYQYDSKYNQFIPKETI